MKLIANKNIIGPLFLLTISRDFCLSSLYISFGLFLLAFSRPTAPYGRERSEDLRGEYPLNATLLPLRIQNLHSGLVKVTDIRLPLLDTFRTFCWNRIRQELMNLERMNPLFAALWIDQECNSLAN